MLMPLNINKIKMLSPDQAGTGKGDGDSAAKNFWWTVEFKLELDDINDRELADEKLFTLAAMTGSIGSELIEAQELPKLGVDDAKEIKIKDNNIILRAAYVSSIDLNDLLINIKEILAQEDFKDVELWRCYRTVNQNWSTQHLDAFPPLNVGKNLVVMAPWHKNEQSDKSRMALYIYPASAFGTGYHESTQIALELLEGVVKSGDNIIDVGTGTGILFIAALKLGACCAAARDIDPVTVDEVKRNMNLNGLSLDACDLQVGNLLDGVTGTFNILTANILLAPNMALLPDVRRVLKVRGRAIFSGMTQTERGAFLAVLNSSGLEVEKELKCGDWWGCRAKLKN
ncbi:MAG: 50S ribosomal protein L11 methyltransferase [Synergistaceae bacterium]|nr:50S ribosomal protein L11 methyltransferase [Synergistaceae bacterium]